MFILDKGAMIAPCDAKKKGLKMEWTVIGETQGNEGDSQVGLKETNTDCSSNIKNFGQQERRQLSCVVWRNSEKKGKRGGEI